MKKPCKKTATGLNVTTHNLLSGNVGCHNCGSTSRRGSGDIVCGVDIAGSKLQVCSGCGLVAYCSRECQKESWPTHKKHCRQIQMNLNKDRGDGERRILLDKTFGGAYSACVKYWWMDRGEGCLVADLSHPAVAYCEGRVDTSASTPDAEKRKITLSFVTSNSREMTALEDALAVSTGTHEPQHKNEMIKVAFLGAKQFGEMLGSAPGQIFPLVLRSPEGLSLHLMMNWLDPRDHQLWRTPFVENRDEIVAVLKELIWDESATSLASAIVSPTFYRRAMTSAEECAAQGRPSVMSGFPPMALGLSLHMVRE